MSGAGTAPQPSRTVLIAVLGACGFASTVSMRLTDPLVPTLAAEFEVAISTVATLATGFGLAYAAGQPVIGALGDALGKVRTIAAAAFILAAVLVASSLVASFDALFAARCAAGVVGGGLIPVAMAAIADRVPVGERQVAIARFIMAVTLGQMAGAAISGTVAEVFGWRACFLLAAGVAFAAGVAVLAVLRPRPAQERPPATLRGALAGYGRVFANRLTLPLLMVVMAEGALVFGLLPYVAAILEERAGLGPAQAGLVIAGSGFGAIVYGLLSPWLVRRLGPARLPILGGSLVALAFTLFALPLPWLTAIPIFVAQGLGFMALHNTLQLMATELAPENRGSAIAVFAAGLFIGQALGPLLMGVLPHSSAEPWGLLVFAVAVACLGGVAARLARQRPR